jgi:hypothetical protein
MAAIDLGTQSLAFAELVAVMDALRHVKRAEPSALARGADSAFAVSFAVD